MYKSSAPLEAVDGISLDTFVGLLISVSLDFSNCVSNTSSWHLPSTAAWDSTARILCHLSIYNVRPPLFQCPMSIAFCIDHPYRIGWDGNPTYSTESTEPTSTETSSSSSCSTAIATDCTAFVSYGVNTDGSTTASATSSQCNTVTACSASGFTSTTATTASCTVSSACSTTTSCPALFGRQVATSACATTTACASPTSVCQGVPTPYIVYPANQNAVSAISDIFTNTFKIDTTDIYAATSDILGTMFWNVPLTDAQVATFTGNSLV